MQFLFNFIMFILLLMVIVVVHEFGHLITAKHFNVSVSYTHLDVYKRQQ